MRGWCRFAGFLYLLSDDLGFELGDEDMCCLVGMVDFLDEENSKREVWNWIIENYFFSSLVLYWTFKMKNEKSSFILFLSVGWWVW